MESRRRMETPKRDAHHSAGEFYVVGIGASHAHEDHSRNDSKQISWPTNGGDIERRRRNIAGILHVHNVSAGMHPRTRPGDRKSGRVRHILSRGRNEWRMCTVAMRVYERVPMRLAAAKILMQLHQSRCINSGSRGKDLPLGASERASEPGTRRPA